MIASRGTFGLVLGRSSALLQLRTVCAWGSAQLSTAVGLQAAP